VTLGITFWHTTADLYHLHRSTDRLDGLPAMPAAVRESEMREKSLVLLSRTGTLDCVNLTLVVFPPVLV
jgi:hypothetical protein